MVPYAYTAHPLNRFFSPYFEPSNLTRARLTSALTPGSWGKHAADKTLLNGVLGNLGELHAVTTDAERQQQQQHGKRGPVLQTLVGVQQAVQVQAMDSDPGASLSVLQ